MIFSVNSPRVNQEITTSKWHFDVVIFTTLLKMLVIRFADVQRPARTLSLHSMFKVSVYYYYFY